MNWLLASDLHGSAYYCRKLLDAFAEESADRLLLLGDILYHGPRNDLPEEYNPKEVIRLLNEASGKCPIYAVRGNCDAEVDQMVLNFPILADYCLIPVGKRMIYATHGHIFNNEKLPPMRDGDILLTGHTHIPACEERDGYLYLNPGSLALPKENTAHSYMILTDSGRILWKDLDGKVLREYDLMR